MDGMCYRSCKNGGRGESYIFVPTYGGTMFAGKSGYLWRVEEVAEGLGREGD